MGSVWRAGGKLQEWVDASELSRIMIIIRLLKEPGEPGGIRTRGHEVRSYQLDQHSRFKCPKTERRDPLTAEAGGGIFKSLT